MCPGRFGRALGGPKGAPGDAFERHRQPLESLKNVGFYSISSNWADQRAEWWVRGRLCRDPGHLWRLLERLGHPQEVLGRSLGVPRGCLGVPGASLVAPWRLLGVPGMLLGGPGGSLGCPQGASGGPGAVPRVPFERHRRPLKSLKNVSFCCISSN